MGKNGITIKKVVSVLGVIILGALGSGVWELIRPLFLWCYTATLSIATLGLDSLKDGIYKDACCSQNFINVLVTYQLVCVVSFFTGSCVIFYIRSAFQPRVNILIKNISLALILGAVISFVQAVRYSYVSGLTNYNTKLEVLAAPYLTDSELKKFRSEYIKITNKKLYLEHITKLEAVLEMNGEKMPSKSFF